MLHVSLYSMLSASQLIRPSCHRQLFPRGESRLCSLPFSKWPGNSVLCVPWSGSSPVISRGIILQRPVQPFWWRPSNPFEDPFASLAKHATFFWLKEGDARNRVSDLFHRPFRPRSKWWQHRKILGNTWNTAWWFAHQSLWKRSWSNRKEATIAGRRRYKR